MLKILDFFTNIYYIYSMNKIDEPKCKIIPFKAFYSFTKAETQNVTGKIIPGRPGEGLPDSIPDWRPYLQRNGLILLSWDKRLCEKGALYTAYWVTSSGTHRYYASPALVMENFSEAMPDRKSYAAEDGIDFYGERKPLYVVHVAPELMMSSSEKITQRPLHISKLKSLGVQVDFNYSFLLTKEKKQRHTERGKQA